MIRRYERNPILTKADVPYPVETVHNAGVVKYRDRYVMIFRSHLRNGRSILGLAERADGFRFRVRSTRSSASKTRASALSTAPSSSPTAPTPVTASASLWPAPRTSSGWKGSPLSRRPTPAT